MLKSVVITPKFNAHQIVDEVIQREWFLAQNAFLSLGKSMHAFIRRYINNNTKRVGSTGKTARAINFKEWSTAGRIEWGIGSIDRLNRLAPHWYVLNYGKKITGGRFRPGGGKYIPIEFTDGFADPSKRGRGTGKVTNIASRLKGGRLPEFIRPMHYIEVCRVRLGAELDRVLERLSRQ